MGKLGKGAISWTQDALFLAINPIFEEGHIMESIAVALLLLALLMAPKRIMGRIARTPSAVFIAMAHIMGRDVTPQQSTHKPGKKGRS